MRSQWHGTLSFTKDLVGWRDAEPFCGSAMSNNLLVDVGAVSEVILFFFYIFFVILPWTIVSYTDANCNPPTELR